MVAALRTLSETRAHGGVMGFHAHRSETLGLEARFGLFLPPAAANGPVPVVMFLAGLTCTEETFAIKAGALRLAAELGLALLAPDTSPRGADVPGEDAEWDFGTGAGFYLDATVEPWARHYRTWSYVTGELPALARGAFPLRAGAMGVFGHSMGGHGALICGLRRPDLFRSCSAIAPIVAPSQVPWGIRAFTAYLGEDRATWAEWDACALLTAGHRAAGPLLVDQGEADKFLAEQLRPELLEAACAAVGQPLTLRRQPGYDHSYWFIQSFVEDHLRHHAERLAGG